MTKSAKSTLDWAKEILGSAVESEGEERTQDILIALTVSIMAVATEISALHATIESSDKNPVLHME